MFHILGIIFFIIIFVLIIGLTIVFRIVKTVLNVGKKVKSDNKNYNSKSTDTYSTTRKATGKKKVFDDNEGEYIEFEEIKD